jgi:hypothetical protein
MESSLDPIFPLPAGTGFIPVREGEGRSIFSGTKHVSAGMTYRAFFVLWEQAERLGRMNYQKYLATAPDIAATYLEAVIWCRQIAYPDVRIEPLSEEEAAKIRAKEVKVKPEKGKKATEPKKLVCPECENADVMKSRRAGIAGFKCRQCKHWWPAETPTAPAQAPDEAPATKTAKKSKKADKKSKKKKSKKDKKKGKE